MFFELAWDDQNEAHIARHDVVPREVEEVCGSRPFLYRQGRENTRYVFGRTHAGRYLFVVLTESMDGRWYIVTARDMTHAEQREFRRRT